MGMPAQQLDWTADAVRALPEDGNRYEVVDGELLVTPAPRLPHQEAVGELFARLKDYCRNSRAGHAMLSPADIEFSRQRLVQPDVFVVPLVDGRRPRSWEEIRTLLLAVEIISPSSARADRQVKRRLYQSEGVADYWIVDLDARIVERWRPQDARPEILADSIEWLPVDGTEPFIVNLDAYFCEVIGD